MAGLKLRRRGDMMGTIKLQEWISMKKIVSIMLALAMIFSLALAAAEESMDERVDRIFRDTKAVGGAFLVAQNGEIVYEHYYGVQQKTTACP